MTARHQSIRFLRIPNIDPIPARPSRHHHSEASKGRASFEARSNEGNNFQTTCFEDQDYKLRSANGE